MIASGGNHAGDGGDGYFYGGIIHASFAVYSPINIAVAGYNSSAHADQTNNVIFDQSPFRWLASAASGGKAAMRQLAETPVFHSSFLGLIGSDVIATGGNSAGSGGDGHFAGSLLDLNIAIYAPINIAIAGPNSTADAHQTNNVLFDQSAVQIAGVGGDGGHGNAAFGGDFAMQHAGGPSLAGSRLAPMDFPDVRCETVALWAYTPSDRVASALASWPIRCAKPQLPPSTSGRRPCANQTQESHMNKSSFPSDTITLKAISTGGNSAGNGGGDGVNTGNISNSPSIKFDAYKQSGRRRRARQHRR